MKDERELLTRELVARKLMRDSGSSVITSILLFFLASLLSGMMYALFSSLSDLLAALVVGIPFAAVTIVFAFFVIRDVLQRRKARHGKFSIVEDELVEMHEDRFSIRQTLLYGNRINIWHILLNKRLFARSSYEHVFQFKSGKRFVANSEAYQNTRLETAAQFSMPGDTFYIVTYEDAPDKIVWLYSTKIYRYQATDRTTSW